MPDTLNPADAQHPDSHYQPLQQAIAPWLLAATAARREALNASSPHVKPWYRSTTAEQRQQWRALNASHWHAQNQVDQRLAALQDVQAFAEPLLKATLKDQFGLELNVKTTFLRLYIPATIPWFPIKSGAARTWTLSLLEAALHNFEADERFEASSDYINQPDAQGQSTPLPGIQATLPIQRFTQLCRTLDIGARYQRYLEENLGLSDAVVAAVLQTQVSASQRAALDTALQLALMKNDIPPAAHQALQRLLDGQPGASLGGKPLRGHDVRMMNAQLTGPVLFAPDLERQQAIVPVIAYVPDDPEHPIKYYPSSAAFMTELTRQLRSHDYQQFFSRFVNHEDRGHFFANLNSRLSHITWHPHTPGDPLPSWRDTPRDRPNLQLSAVAIPGALANHRYQRALDKILNDAKVIAVSTARVDQKARWALWDSLQQIASTLLNIAAMVVAPFVPVLGEAMLAYMAYQLLDETFEGVVDWAQGRTREAFEHLMGTVQALIQLGTFGAGGTIAASELRALMAPSAKTFIDGFKPVPMADGKTRYWQPDLRPYQRQAALPEQSKADEQGIYHHQDQAVITVDRQPFTLNKAPGREHYSLLHPTRPEAYQPRVWHNGTGAWHTELDQPLYWDATTLMRRLGHSMEGFSPTRLEQIRSVSHIPENTLRQLHVQRQPTPAVLADTVQRFRIDEELATFIRQMNSDDPGQYGKADALTQLQLLGRPDLWPDTKALQVVDSQGQVFWQYASQDALPAVRISQAQLNNGELLETALRALEEDEIKPMLGEEFGQPPKAFAPRLHTLRKKIAAAAQARRSNLFDTRYQSLNRPQTADGQRLMDEHKALPGCVADELTRQATAQERRELNAGKLPRSLEDLARWTAQEVRLNRAYEGLYLESSDNPDTRTLALHSLPRLPGWSGRVRLEVHEHAFNGTVSQRIGTGNGNALKVLVHEDGLYQAYDSQGRHLHGETDLYTAILQALPDTERNRLNLHIRQGTQLREALSQVALPRDRLLPALEHFPRRRPTSGKQPRLLGGMDGYPLPDHPAPVPGTPPTVLQRTQALYPGFTHAQNVALLRQLNQLPGGALPGLAGLEQEYAQLEAQLLQWHIQTPYLHPQTGVQLTVQAFSEQLQNRLDLSNEIKRCWRRETPMDTHYGDERDGYILANDNPIMGHLPRLEADFSHVSALSLTGDESTLGAHAFCASFRNVRHLGLRNIPLGTLPEGLESMPRLTELVLSNANIRLSAESLATLTSLSRLESLDLYANPLGLVPNVEGMPDLRYLDLAATGIEHLPAGVLTRPHLQTAVLNNNRITALPDALFALPDLTSEAFDFGNNPFPEAVINRIKSHFQRTGERWDASAPSVDIERLKALYPTFTTPECNRFLYGMPGSLQESRVELTRMEAEYEKLQADLEEWRIDAPHRHPTQNTLLSQQQRAEEQARRFGFKNLMEQCWRRETPIDSFDDGPTAAHELRYEVTLLGDLPALTANFDHVSMLSLYAQNTTSKITPFLERFRRLRSLSVQGYPLGNVPEPIFHMPRLKELILPQCTLRLTTSTAEQLAGLEQLTYLDLSDNPLGITPRLTNMRHLKILDLQNTGIRHVPPGLFSLRELTIADLSNNAIRHIGTGIFEVPADIFHALDWGGNPLSPQSSSLLRRYRQRMGVQVES
ncbi:leucine-rich repeat domain-containing protein [Pseudomonas sp. MWU16-30323]|uniref:leucine-rich repeat domain-containing protein n=1 Tax=Pseudomonas sp. MWU16-30323 TaxID=2878094 RepID=UPI001CFC369F|nr:leucine-rich repeat domain-containing protein [Pseudomonas sp. MWU16-30323]